MNCCCSHRVRVISFSCHSHVRRILFFSSFSMLLFNPSNPLASWKKMNTDIYKFGFYGFWYAWCLCHLQQYIFASICIGCMLPVEQPTFSLCRFFCCCCWFSGYFCWDFTLKWFTCCFRHVQIFILPDRSILYGDFDELSFLIDPFHSSFHALIFFNYFSITRTEKLFSIFFLFAVKINKIIAVYWFEWNNYQHTFKSVTFQQGENVTHMVSCAIQRVYTQYNWFDDIFYGYLLMTFSVFFFNSKTMVSNLKSSISNYHR